MKIFEITLFWFHIAPTYYGLMYALGFIFGYLIIKHRKVMNNDLLDNFLLFIVWGVVLWGRLGYILFYNFDSFIHNPFILLRIWEWWMSFHWWVIWVILAMLVFARIYKQKFLNIADHLCLVLPIWLGLGRFWNYLNEELLWYEGYTWPLAIEIGRYSYFPSPLLELLLEWIVLGLILNYLYIKNKLRTGQIASLFLILYWIFRIIVEIFFRTPDAHIGLLLNNTLSLWTLLSIPMVISGLILFIYFHKKK